MQALSAKLKTHWTNIANHLYLKSDVPVPLPTVGPLAEILDVTRGVCHEILALAAAGSLTAADVGVALDADTVSLLGRLAQWLQRDPTEQLLLNTERSESLWQLLLLTLQALLGVLQPEDEKTRGDKELVARFKKQLKASGLLGDLDAGSSVADDAGKAATNTDPASSGLLAALQWLLQHHPNRCLTATQGAWLLLQQLLTADGGPEESSAASSSSNTATAANGDKVDTEGAAAAADKSHTTLSEQLMLSLAKVLQAYVDCAYRNVAKPAADTAAAQESSGGSNADGRGSTGGRTPARRLASQEKLQAGSSGGSSPARKRGTAAGDEAGSSAAAAAAAPEADDAQAVLRGFAHAVCLVDDPSTLVFQHLLVVLHGLQIQLLVTATSLSEGLKAANSDSEQTEASAAALLEATALPGRLHLQVLAMADAWLQLQQQASPAAAAAPAMAAGFRYQHEALLPLPSLALEAVTDATLDKPAAVQQLVQLCAAALQRDCFRFMLQTHKKMQQRQQQDEKGAGSSNSDLEAFDTAAIARIALDTVSLQQACGLAACEQLLHTVGLASNCSMRAEVMQLVQQQGKRLLHALQQYVQSGNSSAEAAGAATGEKEGAAAAAGGSRSSRPSAQERCMLCADVLMEVCSRGRHSVDEELVALLTETDPATFYTIMDTLVRTARSDVLTVLLPLSACFLQHDMQVTVERVQRQRAQAQHKAGSESDPGSNSSSGVDAQAISAASRSMVVLNDPDVCRTFAAALHGYSKTAIASLQEPADACSGCGHDHSHDHSHEHGHEHGHHHHHHHRPVPSLLHPLVGFGRWLMFSYELSLQAAQDDGPFQQLKASDAAAAAAAASATAAESSGSNSSKAKSDRLLASVSTHAEHLQATSQTAAGSLVLTLLLARAAVPVCLWMQDELEQLQAASAAAAGSSSSSSGDVRVPATTAVGLYASLMLLRNVWSAVCARYALSQVMEEQLHKLLKAASAAATAAAGAAKQAEADPAGQEAAEEAERVAKGTRAAAAGTSAALHGRSLARGWNHLAFLLPPGALNAARTFQAAWPADLLSVEAAAILETAQQHLMMMQQGHGSDTEAAAPVVLPAAAHQQLLQLAADAQQMLTGLLNDVPLPVGCNNPACTSIDAVAEATLSINKRCSQCLAAHYCSKECLTQHWPAHKKACKRLRQQQVPGGVPSSS